MYSVARNRARCLITRKRFVLVTGYKVRAAAVVWREDRTASYEFIIRCLSG